VSWVVWLTGPPASGKTALAAALRGRLALEGVRPVVLESDALRRVLTPEPSYEPEERDRFYQAVADLAALIAEQGIPVVVDATAPRRRYRDRLRGRVRHFLEILVATPLDVRELRDPKGLYRRARLGQAPHLPGATEAYEEPEKADLVVSGVTPPEDGARSVAALLRDRGLLPLEK
jgi:adenylylsulfate kinase